MRINRPEIITDNPVQGILASDGQVNHYNIYSHLSGENHSLSSALIQSNNNWNTIFLSTNTTGVIRFLAYAGINSGAVPRSIFFRLTMDDNVITDSSYAVPQMGATPTQRGIALAGSFSSDRLAPQELATVSLSYMPWAKNCRIEGRTENFTDLQVVIAYLAYATKNV